MRPPERRRPSLSVALTTRCPGRCAYCFQPARPPRDLPWAALRPALDRLLAAGGPAEVLVSGGEPLLAWPLLRRALEHVRDGGGEDRIRWTVLTDGLLLSADVLAALAGHRVTVQISCDGAAQELRRPGTSVKLGRLLTRLRDRPPGSRPHVRVNMTVTPQTVALMPESCACFLRLGVEDFRLSPVYAPDAPGAEDPRPALSAAFAEVGRLCLDHFDATGESPCAWFRKRPRTRRVEGAGAATAARAAASGRPSCSRNDPDHEALDAAGRRQGCLALAGRDLVARGRPAPSPDLDRCHTSHARCLDCPHHLVCPRCALPGLMAGSVAEPYRVPGFVCAFNSAALAERERFPDCPEAAFVVTHPEWLRRAVDGLTG